MDNTSLDAFIRMIAAQGILGILRVIGAAVLRSLGLYCHASFVPCKINIHCSQELRALNSKMDLVMARMVFECKASNGYRPMIHKYNHS